MKVAHAPFFVLKKIGGETELGPRVGPQPPGPSSSVREGPLSGKGELQRVRGYTDNVCTQKKEAL